jgi:phage-related protein
MSIRRRRWRDYRTAAGARPVLDFLVSLDEDVRVEVTAAMKDVRENGMVAARHVRGDVYEVRASHRGTEYRVLFANEGKKGRILLSLHGFNKKTRRTPPRLIDLAERRLADWRLRGRADKNDDS